MGLKVKSGSRRRVGFIKHRRHLRSKYSGESAKVRDPVAPRKANPRFSSADFNKTEVRRVLDSLHCDVTKQVDVHGLCIAIVTLAQALRERQFYPYQVSFGYRVCESILLHDGEILTCLMARQMGKTEIIGAIVASLALILPFLASKFPDDWHLNITDDKGVYRGYGLGLQTGIYAPRMDQAQIMFERVRQSLETKTAKKILSELKIQFEENNGNTIALSNGSSILCESASEQSKIEGATHHLLIAEEAQDISDLKMRKSLHPMVSATGGTIVKVGTAIMQKCDFYTAIKQNERAEAITGRKNHFFFPYTIGIQFNSLYRKTIEREKLHLGSQSDEFRTSYGCEWIFERGMFVTTNLLFNKNVAATSGFWSIRYPKGLPHELSQYSIVAGIDWGAAYDSTVVTLLAVDWLNPLESGEGFNLSGSYHYTYYEKHVIDWLEFIGDDYETQFWNVVHYLSRIPRLRKIVTDSNTCGRPIFDRLSATFAKSTVEVCEFNFQRKLKSDAYKLLYSDFCAKRLTFPANQAYRDQSYGRFIAQMLDLRKSYDKGLMCVAHPDEKGAHDDYPDSLVMAAWGAGSSSRFGSIETQRENIFFV